MKVMSTTIETTYRNGRIQLPDDLRLREDTRVTVIVPDSGIQDSTADSACSIPDLASDIGSEDFARNLRDEAKNLFELFAPVRGLLSDEEIDTLFARNRSLGRPVDLS